MADGHAALLELLERLPGRRIAVVGDVMLDEYLHGGVKRVSPEAPVLVVDVDRMTWAPGGAANVAANIRALGAEVSLIGLVGKDYAADRLRRLLEDMQVGTDGLLEDPNRDTSLKTRIIAHHQQVVRVDRERREKPSEALVRKLRLQIEEKLAECDALVVSDYNKGVVGELTQTAVTKAREAGVLVTSNPKPANLRFFQGADVITLNNLEAEAASGESIDGLKALVRAGAKIVRKTRAGCIVITRGANGMSVFRQAEQSAEPAHIPGMPVEVYDVAGAGDTVVSTLTLAMAAGADEVQAATLANYAAATVVRKVGVACVSTAEVANLIRESESRSI
ncbi:MAG: D-glycero-beta-D-manno-heptose-7-phosphate kinase [Armatimonadetes bacterium]|nr:D-glycero-beta-D-manno-heptose-7-phosphate kinase [Armatimonadota bacterium]